MMLKIVSSRHARTLAFPFRTFQVQFFRGFLSRTFQICVKAGELIFAIDFGPEVIALIYIFFPRE